MIRMVEQWFAPISASSSISDMDEVAVCLRRENGIKLGAFTVVARGNEVALVHLSYGSESYGGFPWTLPGGGVDDEELPSKAAIREVREEIGVELAVDDLELAAVLHRPYIKNKEGEKVGELTFVYACRVAESTAICANSAEILEAMFVEFNLRQWLAVPDTGTGGYLQPLRRHWIYWAELGIRKLRDKDSTIQLWTYLEGREMALPINDGEQT